MGSQQIHPILSQRHWRRNTIGMKLTEEERKIVVGLQMEKAHRFLEQADEMCKQEYWDIASNRYYYACYHAVQALLIKNELFAHTHDGLLTLFGLHFVKTGKVDS